MSSAPDRHRPTVAEIDLGAFARNVRAIAGRLPSGSELIAVLKADAYGHGAIPFARECETLPVPMIAVALVEEADALRDAGITRPLLILGALSAGEAVAAAEHGFIPGVSSLEALAALRDRFAAKGRDVHLHLKLDSGMGRLGFIDEELDAVGKILRAAPALRLDALYTHYASASDPDDPATGHQTERFAAMVDRLAGLGIRAPIHHSANSAATMRSLVSEGDYVRIGLALYGAEPLDRGESRLEPVMRWTTRVARIKSLPTGHPAGYGATWRAPRPSRIAALPVGYADGFNRLLSNNGDVLIGGRRVPIVGRISMDTTLVDVTDMPSVAVGDEAVLLGRQGRDEISAEELARRTNTISYEILTSVGARVPRAVRGESEST